MGTHVSIPLGELTNHQLLLHSVRLQEQAAETLSRLDTYMSNLQTSVDDLTASVDAIGVRFSDLIDPLTEANAELRTQVQALLDADVIEDAEQAAALQTAMDAQDAAAAQIEEQVTELNAIGTPVAEPPVEPEPEPEPPIEDPVEPTP